MTPVEFIRKSVLGLTQAELAGELGTTQATVSRWETAGTFPADAMPKIRALASNKPWSDTWFFEVPAWGKPNAAEQPEAAE